MASAPITVQGALDTYPVIINAGALSDDLPRFVAGHSFTRIAVITNTTLAPLYGEALVARLPNAFLSVIEDGEQYKTLDTAETLYADLLAHGMDRSSLVIALGGGVVGDLAGFVAATFMRGIAFIQAPTSLLAMVDASIGGKVGVDLPQGKNLAGAFKDPLGVFADVSTLQSLPDIEFRCGLSEIIKAGLIDDVTILDHIQAHGPQPVEEIITLAVKVKQRVVNEDRLEGGVRAYLNLGHTFGHAIEHVSGYAWKHGQAVAVGLVAAARLSARHELCSPDVITATEQVLLDNHLPTRYADLDPQALWDAMRHDKKWRGGTPHFVLLEGIGKPVIASDIDPHDVIAVLAELREE